MQGIADKTRVAWRSGQSRNLPIGGDFTLRNAPHHLINTPAEQSLLHSLSHSSRN